MNLSFDSVKNERNILIRGLDFSLVVDFDWSTALINEDVRKSYGENRYVAIGFIRGRIFVVIFTPRENYIHVISLRKANKREVKYYEATN